ncbi:MAG: organic solvent tolerance protein [Bdellovibrio sp. CG10_big_fil_rev_8_21_14_0_10_47_8]|nr:MAG: organic solvent tolerance protein [Bdellovibrio sp. CG10_big_fil_rev_8_21_14_0_10_47_8]
MKSLKGPSWLKHLLVFTVVFSAVFFALTERSLAKELTSRLGVGYRNNLVTFSLPSIAAFYYPSANMAVMGSLGVDTEDLNSKFAFAGGVRRMIFKEDNMNFFMGGQLAMVNNEVSGTKDSGFEIAALVGGEFFLQGLESLGFNFETGMGITNVKKTRFRTLGDSFVNAGMVFYF